MGSEHFAAAADGNTGSQEQPASQDCTINKLDTAIIGLYELKNQGRRKDPEFYRDNCAAHMPALREINQLFKRVIDQYARKDASVIAPDLSFQQAQDDIIYTFIEFIRSIQEILADRNQYEECDIVADIDSEDDDVSEQKPWPNLEKYPFYDVTVMEMLEDVLLYGENTILGEDDPFREQIKNRLQNVREVLKHARAYKSRQASLAAEQPADPGP